MIGSTFNALLGEFTHDESPTKAFLHPSVCLSDLVRDIKLASSQWMKKHPESFPLFRGWGKEYGAFSYAQRDCEMVAAYIARQREHHQRETFEQEFRKHVERAGLDWSEYRLT